MINSRDLRKRLILMAVTASFITSNFAYAAAANSDIDTLIQNQQQILDQLNAKKSQAANDEITNQIKSLSDEIDGLKSQKSYDAESAVDSLATQVNSLKDQLAAQTDEQSKIMDELKKIENQQISGTAADGSSPATASSTGFLVNPGPSTEVSYTQDAVNAQGNSTMTFSYAPNQLYKIYCRTGYLTDLEFKKGEKIKFVGGGDTSAWAVNSTDVDGTPHLYIKPVVQASTTNIIVTTDKHSYQIILNTSDWYNPMVRWTYESEDLIQNMLQKQEDEKTVTGKLGVSNYDQLNFDYQISGDSDLAPSMVFDDGTQTVIRFKKLGQKMPVLFVREQQKRELSLVNYNVKDNCYIVNKVFSEAELRYSDKQVVKIKRK